MTDVPLADSEKSGLNCGDAVETAIAIEAFVVAANPLGPGRLAALNREQMQAILSGATSDWSDVGGANQSLVVINRKGSGTRQSMANYLFGGGDDSQFRGDAAEQESNEDATSNLAKTPGAISYLGTAYVSDPGLVVTLGIQRPEGLILTNKAVIGRSQWPIGGPGLAVTKSQPNPLAVAFLSYLISPQFQSEPVWASS
jgi:phosphate transport system substrate-binding protein